MLCLKYLFINNIYRYFEGGIKTALNDRSRSGREPIRKQEDKLLIIDVSCQKPKDFGYAGEIWTQKNLAKHLRSQYPDNPAINKISQASISRIHAENNMKPFKVKYYIQTRDPEFEKKNEIF